MTEKVITRFPPSPTGFLHIGSVRTALFNYLFTKKNNGTMYLRFEDTDLERSKREFEEDIIQGLDWLGITYTKPEVFRQSERTQIYKKYFDTLLKQGLAYEAEESKDGTGKMVVRFRNPNKKITFQDLVRGEVTFDTTELGDFVIAKSINEPLYHLAVVIDDYEMGVTHVIRGEDHISNTPRQILILEALGFPRPAYAHIPLILAPDRTKMSKRHGAVSVNEYRKMGILPQALTNYLALLGWNPGTDQEIFTMEELIEQFDLNKIQKGGAIFDLKKLDWINKEHIKRLPPEEQLEMRLREVRKEPYFAQAPELDISKISWKDTDSRTTRKHLEEVKSLVGNDDAIMKYAEREGKGAVLWPLRFALSGQEKSPDPFTLMAALGKEESVRRIEKALELL